MATKPIKFLELHYTMTQFLIITNIFCVYPGRAVRDWWSASQASPYQPSSRYVAILSQTVCQGVLRVVRIVVFDNSSKAFT